MNRTILTVTAVLSASSLLLVDSAIKGTVLLALAAVVALILRRDSAATRHLVWLLAIVAMLVVPLLSAMLPQWRVLPAWMSSSRPVVADISPPSISKSPGGVIESTERAAPLEVERPSATVFQPATTLPDSQPALATPEAVPAPAVRSWNWIHALPLVWVIGFAVLMLRLWAARWMLWNSERLATVVCRRVAPQLAFESQSDSARAHDPIVIAMETICSQLGIGHPVTLLIHPDKTIPVVWGILRCRLMLPAAARLWSEEQLQSVLLHELAHVKRRDTIVQLLAQVACALHWFNPLVWFAAWRLDVERERSCDDLVLASGVRPSAYAGHLLEVVAGLSPARWTQSCGLAMARKSSLEGRLTAVLGKDLNRRDVSVALAGLALAIAVGVAVPIAMLRAADEKWNPPHAAHVGSNDFSTFCVHDGKEATFVIAYRGDFNSTGQSSSNSKARTWTDSVMLTAKQPGIALSFHRTHTAPGKLSITTAPTEARDLSKPAPPPREFGQKEYDLAKGRVFLLSDNGNVRQLDIATPVVTDQESAKKLAKLIAAIPPQDREDVALTPNRTGKLALETIAKLKWGEPVNGLRMALAYPPALGDALLGKKPHFELVVQNVAEKEIHFLASDDAPNPRELNFRADNRTVLVIADKETAKAEWHLQPGRCGVLRMFTKEVRDDDGKSVSAGIEGDLSKIDRNHAVAEMEIAKAPAGAWTGKLVTGQTRGSADVAAAPAPMHKVARAYYEVWQRFARANGDIPGALVGELAAAVKTFIRYNPTWETVPKLNELLPRLDATHDWKSADAIALLDELAGIQDSPIKAAPWRGTRHTIRKGEALPKKFADVPWGEAQPNGLRAAWVLEPGGAEHRIGAALKARLLVQNAGKIPVMVQVPTWHQGWVKANDAKGAEVQASGLSWTTMAQLVPVRLAPGEYIEINTPGIGFGPRAGMGPWAGPRVGSNVLAKPGDELTLTHGLVPLDGSEVGVSEDDPHVSGPGWWLAHIKARLNRELPLPADAAERTRLLDRAVRELFAAAPTAEETAAFVADKTPDALDALAKRLVARVDVVSFSGKLPTAPAKLRVLAADANADKQPRVVLGPGEYPLSKGTADRGAATLKIVGRSIGNRHTNDAQLLFEATEFTGALPPDPHKLEVPDGWGTWAIVCRPDSDFFYLLSKGTVRKIDYSNPRKVTDTLANDLPAEFRDEVKRILDIHDISDAQQAEMLEKPAAPAASLRTDEEEKPKTAATESPPKTTEKNAYTAWGKEVGGLQAGLGFNAGGRRAFSHGEKVTLVVRVRNVGKEEAKFDYISENFIVNPPTVLDEEAKAVPLARGFDDSGIQLAREANLAPGKEIWLAELTLEFGSQDEADADFRKSLTIYGTGMFQVGFENVLGTGFIKPSAALSKLATGKLQLEVKEPEKLPPEKERFTAWGEEVNGLQAGLGFRAGEQRVYRHGETVTFVVRVRNVGKEEVKFQYLRQFFFEQPPTVFNENGELKQLGGTTAFGEHIPVEAKLVAGKEIELYELKLYLGTGIEEGIPKYPYISGTGKFQVQYEKVLGNSSSGSIKLDPALSKLATGKLELEIQPDAPPASPRADVKPDSRQLFNEDYAAIAVQSTNDVNFVLFYNGFLSSGITEWSSGKKWRFEGSVYLVDVKKSQVAGKKVSKRVVALKYTSDAPATLFLDGKAYDLAAPNRVFVLRDEGEPLQTHRTHALRNEKDLVAIGDLAMEDLKNARTTPKPGAIPVRAQGEWSAEWQALSKVVAKSRGLVDWKADDVIAWGAEEGGLRSGLLMPARANLSEKVTPLLVLKNVSDATKEMKVCTSLNVLEPTVRTADGKTAVEVLKISLRGTDALFPVTLKAGEQLEFAGPPVQFGVERDAEGKPKVPDWPVAGVVMGAETVLLKFHFGNVRGPETGEVAIQVAAAGASIHGKVLKPDGSPAAGVQVRVDDGIERWKFRGPEFPDLPRPVTTAADGTFSIEVPKHSVATNYEAFASSDDFAPLNAKVPEGGDVGVMQFAKGSRVTGRVIGLDGAGLVKVGIWCKRLDWHGRGPAPTKLTSTGIDGTFSLPPIATGRHVLQILTRELGAKELTVAFANHIIEAKDDAPVAVEIRPLPTVDLTLDVRVLRGKPEFPDFELRVSGTLPGHKAGEPASYWTRNETTKLTEGKHTIAVPAGLQNVTLRADRIYMRKDDEPVFLWRREGDRKRVSTNTLELGLMDQPQSISLAVHDAPTKVGVLPVNPVKKPPTDSTTHKDDVTDDSAPPNQPQVIQGDEQPIKTIPVTSKELSGIWYGATDRTGVVVRFIGRESRVKGTRGVVSGNWIVHVADGSIGAALDFTDDPKAGRTVLRCAISLPNQDFLGSRIGLARVMETRGVTTSNTTAFAAFLLDVVKPMLTDHV